jgi:hypothetical protein
MNNSLYLQTLRQKPGKSQFGDRVVLQSLEHAAAASSADRVQASLKKALRLAVQRLSALDSVAIDVAKVGGKQRLYLSRRMYMERIYTDNGLQYGLSFNIRPVFSRATSFHNGPNIKAMQQV